MAADPPPGFEAPRAPDLSGTWPERPPAPAPGGYATPGPRSSTSATAALVLGIAGLIVLPIVCSVAAIVVGLQAQKELDRHPELGGRRNARAGVVLGVVGLAAWALGVIVLSAVR